jgi:negative regulator of sigma E activity
MHPNETAIHDYVDEALDPRARADLDRHLEGCADCRRLVADLREIRKAFAGLKDDLREPPVRAWGRLERAIRLEHPSQSTQNPQNTQKRSALRFPRVLRSTFGWVGAAAILILATVVGLQFRPGRRAAPDGTSTSAPVSAGGSVSSGEAAQTVEAELRAAEEHYTKAITGLEQITRTEQGTLDPGTAATLQKNLAVIDQAISESRAALQTQPASEPAQESLVENFKAKIGLLQDTVALINEMRKGNEAGAARIVSGLKPKGD